MAREEMIPTTQQEFDKFRTTLEAKLIVVVAEEAKVQPISDQAAYYSALATLAGRRYTTLNELRKLFANYPKFWRSGAAPVEEAVPAEVDPMARKRAELAAMERQLAVLQKAQGKVPTPPPVRASDRQMYLIVYRKEGEPELTEVRKIGAKMVAANHGRFDGEKEHAEGQCAYILRFNVVGGTTIEQVAKTIRATEEAFPGVIATWDQPKWWDSEDGR